MSSTTAETSTAEFTTEPVGAKQRRTYSTRELQAAASALVDGQFARNWVRTGPVTVPGSSPEPGVTPHRYAGTVARAERGPEVARVVPMLGPLVRVWAANAGAGASTITLALADAADGAGLRTRVLDAAAPAWSGLIGASVTELGASGGWRRGRRGAGVLIDRVEAQIWIPELVPTPRDADGIDLTVLDTGWTIRELDASTAGAGDCWVASLPAHAEVVVTRPHTLPLGQVEAVLAGLDDSRVVVVVVGARRWSWPGFAAAGPRLRRLHEDHGVVFVPLLSVKALPGLGPDLLPRQLMSAAQRLLDRVTTITGPPYADRA